ncbi:MAG: universal stress protein [Planctomycetes bacterium]|nr:universal stress protein [Planctomycetota bacterium]
MFKKVLIPLDGSELSESLLEPLKRLLGDIEDASVLLLHVTPLGPSGEGATPVPAENEALTRVAARLADWPLASETHEVLGDPASAILETVERLKPDLIAMATHGRTGLERLVRGSVAERVLRRVSVPLLLVNPGSKARREDIAFRRILVPLDGSPLADGVLPYVITIARSVGAEVTLLRVEPIEPYMADPLSGVPFVEPTYWNPQSVKETLAPQLDRLLDAGIDAEIEARIGDAAGEITALAKDYDLVAFSSHGRGGVSRWWFGSVAEQVLRVVERPIFMVRGEV